MMKSNYATVFDRQPLFPGNSCYPLSPGGGTVDEDIKEFANDKLKNDQLNKIFDVIGTPQDLEDLAFIKDEQGIKYIKSFPFKEKLDLGDKYPGTDERGIELLSKMLEFNPNKRISASEILSDSYFDDIRIPEQEDFEPIEIDLKFDDEELAIEDLRQWVVEEIKACSIKDYQTLEI